DPIPIAEPVQSDTVRRPAIDLQWRNDSAAFDLPDIPALTEATQESRRVRHAFVVSAIVYTLLSTAVVWWGLTSHGMAANSALAVAWINTASAVALVLAFFRVRLMPAIAVGVVWLALQFVVLTTFVGAPWRSVTG